jgi:hypothetical protein
MKKDVHAYTCTRVDCADNCRLVLIGLPAGSTAGGGAGEAPPTALLARLLHKDCGRYLVPMPESGIPTAEPFDSLLTSRRVAHDTQAPGRIQRSGAPG